MKNEAFQRAITICGGQVKFADLLGVSQGTVSKWDKVPVEDGEVLTVEKHTGVPRWELRPDIYPPDEFQHHQAPT